MHMIQTGVMVKKFVNRRSACIAQRFELRGIELDILAFLYRASGCDTASDIMTWRPLSKAHVSQSIKNLQNRQLITLYEDAADRRRMHILLTPAACEIARQALEIQRQCESILFAGISEEERATLGRIMQKMNANLTGIPEDFWGNTD